MCLRFRAETLNQQQLMEQLPKSICKSIYQYLFLPIVEQVYLFKGVSRELLLLLVKFLLLVTYKRAEYIPPREDVIMQNEASCDFYILVSREIEIISCHMDKEMVLEALKSGDMFGEISALCNRPQSFTVRTKTKEVFSLFINKVNCADSIVGDAKVREISGGEKKRLSVACKLIASPSVIFADEPTTGCFGHNKYIYFFNTSNST